MEQDNQISDFKPKNAGKRPVQPNSADRIVRDAEARSDVGARPDAEPTRSEAPQAKPDASSYLGMARAPAERSEPSTSSGSDEAAPLSSALGVPTLVKARDPRSDSKARDSVETGNVYFTEGFFPLLSDNPTPLSSTLGLPVLVKEKDRD